MSEAIFKGALFDSESNVTTVAMRRAAVEAALELIHAEAQRGGERGYPLEYNMQKLSQYTDQIEAALG